MKKKLIAKFAKLVVVTGVNVQKGQPVIVRGNVAQHDFVEMVVEECYKAGAKWVRVDWIDQALTKLDYNYQSLEELSTVSAWKEAQLQQMVDELPAAIHIYGQDPNGLRGIDMGKMQKARQITYPITRKYSDALENRQQWCIVSVPSPEWAAMVFPDLPVDEAVEKLWEAILMTVRITEDNDPIKAWEEHNRNFEARCKWLNDQHFDTITYRSSNGTDFKVGLIPEGVWCGGRETTIGGVSFNPNMPTEEIFTSPMRGMAEGTLVSTKPLSYQGQIIENFSLTFEGGKAVRWEAEKGKDLLDRMLSMDEGAPYLGELALVPVSSPISQSGILFFETLFDENASCHVAMGRGFNDCIEGFKTRTDEECKALGVNDSMIHVDFMVGAPDMCITGWKDGVSTPIFINGEWA